MPILLGLLFLLSFSLPVVFAVKAAGFFLRGDGDDSDGEDRFPDAQTISLPGTFLRVRPSTGLDPVADKDFLFVGWFKLKKLPEVGQKVVVFTKNDQDGKKQGGYSIAISRDADAFRPVVYWKDSRGNGGIYPFASMSILSRKWFMLALSFREKRFLGVHGALLDGVQKPKVKLLGGYEVEDGILPTNGGDLQIGAMNQNVFRGQIGPFGIFMKQGMSDQLPAILDNFIKSPEDTDRRFTSNEIVLWSPGSLEDRGPERRTIELVGVAKSPKRKG